MDGTVKKSEILTESASYNSNHKVAKVCVGPNVLKFSTVCGSENDLHYENETFLLCMYQK